MRYARILPGRWYECGGVVDVEVDAADTETIEIGSAVSHSLPLLIFAVR